MLTYVILSRHMLFSPHYRQVSLPDTVHLPTQVLNANNMLLGCEVEWSVVFLHLTTCLSAHGTFVLFTFHLCTHFCAGKCELAYYWMCKTSFFFCCPCFPNWHVAFVWNGDRFRFCCLFEITYYYFFLTVCLQRCFLIYPTLGFRGLQSLARLCHSAQPVLVWWMHYVSHESTNWLVTSIFAACKSRACLCGSVMQIWKNCHFHTFYRLEHPCL